MRSIKIRFGLGVMAAFFFSLTLCVSAQAFSVDVRGKDAEKTLSMLRASPYVKNGSGKKVVYVIGSPACGQTKGFYRAAQDLRNDYEFRWLFKLLKNNKSDEDRHFGIYESRSTSDLNASLTGGQSPVKDPVGVKPYAALARLVADVAIRDFNKKSAMFPMLIMPVEGGLRAMDFTKEMQDASSLKSLIGAALPDPEAVDMDLDAVMDSISRARSTDGLYCAAEDTSFGILPHGSARMLGLLAQGTCLEGVSRLDSGWIGVRYLPDAEVYGPAYIRADMVYHVSKP